MAQPEIESRSPYLAMLCGSLAFSLIATPARGLSGRCDRRVTALVRTLTAFVLVLMLARVKGVSLVLWRPRVLWLRSISGSISLVCTFYAFTRLHTSDVPTLTHMFPLWVALLSWPLLREGPTLRLWLALVCGLLGVVLIQQPHFAKGNFAIVITILSSFSTAVAMLGLHRLHGVDVRAVVVHFSGVSLLFCGLAFLFLDVGNATNDWSWTTVGMLLGVGVAATVGQGSPLASEALPARRVSEGGFTAPLLKKNPFFAPTILEQPRSQEYAST